jgi:hypothetical protein
LAAHATLDVESHGQPVMIRTPGQSTKHFGIGAVNYHPGETEVIFRRHKRRKEIAELLQRLVDKHPTSTIYVAWDNARPHEEAQVARRSGQVSAFVPAHL